MSGKEFCKHKFCNQNKQAKNVGGVLLIPYIENNRFKDIALITPKERFGKFSGLYNVIGCSPIISSKDEDMCILRTLCNRFFENLGIYFTLDNFKKIFQKNKFSVINFEDICILIGILPPEHYNKYHMNYLLYRTQVIHQNEEEFKKIDNIEFLSLKMWFNHHQTITIEDYGRYPFIYPGGFPKLIKISLLLKKILNNPIIFNMSQEIYYEYKSLI